jgi:hypothetical protein
MSSENSSENNSPLANKVIKPTVSVTAPEKNADSDEDQEPPQISSEQLLRRASFKKILEDLSSSADAINKSESSVIQSNPSASILQQAGLSNPALLPLIQNLQQSALASAVANQNPIPSNDLTQQLAAAAMMLPSNQLNAQQQLTAALLGSQSNAPSPLIATGHNGLQLPTNIFSTALLNASSSNPLTNFSAQLAAAAGNSSGSSLNLSKSPIRNTSSSESLPADDGTKKREIRLMKNREAARECRRKKKEYIRCLESRVAVLESQNQALIGELRALKELYLPKNQE